MKIKSHEENNGVSLDLRLGLDPWVIKKRIEASDIGNLSSQDDLSTSCPESVLFANSSSEEEEEDLDVDESESSTNEDSDGE
nr:hypothetical protein CFP56_05443 [Quercus suber]